jgi:hypothetical protein
VSAEASAADTIRKHWERLAQSATWIMAVVGVYLTRPPGLALGDDRRIVPFAGFVVAALLGIATVVSTRWRGERYVWRWWAAAIASLVLSIGGFAVYDTYMSSWTEPFASTRVVVGTRWTATGDKARPHYETVRGMLVDFGGDAEVLWEKDELEARRQALALIYVGCVAASALTMLSTVQAIACLKSAETGTAATPTEPTA